jgi:hypothetical protein
MTAEQIIAREVRPSIERLDALLVPLSTSFKDSNGVSVMSQEDARRVLLGRLREVHGVIGKVLEVVS